MRPRCYNRPAFLPGRWVKDGERVFGKPNFRWLSFNNTLECHSQEQIEWEGFDCSGCRWAEGQS